MNESRIQLLLDTRKVRKEGAYSIAKRQAYRLAKIVSYARTYSPYYRIKYKDLPENIEDVTLLPITNKKELMSQFDSWITDRDVTKEKVASFLDNPENLGEQFLGKYLALTTSGTSGTVGYFLKDNRELKVTSALSARMLSDWLSFGEIARIIIRGIRMAMIFATDRPIASFTAAKNLQKKAKKLFPKAIEIVSVYDPISRITEQLNAFQPAMISSYASIMSLLANEQKEGRLHIRPVFITITAEGLAEGEYDRIAGVFNTKVRNGYACTECPFMSYACEHAWLHVNTDWVIFEPVDEHYKPVAKGTLSHTVLITNLANLAQPILRYDLGDSVLERADPCPCGNPLPAIKVKGRTADMLLFQTEKGIIKIPPLVFSALLSERPGVEQFQIVQTTATTLQVRLRVKKEADSQTVWNEIVSQIKHLLLENGLGSIVVEQSTKVPEQTSGGKYREVIPFHQ